MFPWQIIETAIFAEYNPDDSYIFFLDIFLDKNEEILKEYFNLNFLLLYFFQLWWMKEHIIILYKLYKQFQSGILLLLFETISFIGSILCVIYFICWTYYTNCTYCIYFIYWPPIPRRQPLMEDDLLAEDGLWWKIT